MGQKKESKREELELEEKWVFIAEDDGDGDDDLSLIDIKAAIAKQGIPIAELFNKQDIASNRAVLELVHEAEAKVRAKLESEIVILKSSNTKLQKFRDKAETTTLVEGSKELADKSPKIVEYIKARLSTGRGVDMAGDLTDDQRQEKVNEAIKEELELIEKQGIIFKDKDDTKPDEDNKDLFKDSIDDDDTVDMSEPDNNPLIPSGKNKE